MRRLELAELVAAADAGLPMVEVGGRGIPDPAMCVVDLDGVAAAEWREPALSRVAATLATPSPVVIGLASQPLPPESEPLLEALTCTFAPAAPGKSWVKVVNANDADRQLARIAARVGAAPSAATALATMLPVVDRLPVPEALVVESAHYSMLLAGPEHAEWRASMPRRAIPPSEDPVVLTRAGNELIIELNTPRRHNAFSRAVRDAVVEALVVAAVDPAVRVTLRGNGPSFCSGGDLDEFGTNPDVVAAYGIRLAHSAGLAVHRVADRLTTQVHGAVIGAGVEIASFSGRVVAEESAWFCLPELGFGLIPGAGGTVSVSRRIGRWRTAWMVLTGDRVALSTALEWGLVDGRT